MAKRHMKRWSTITHHQGNANQNHNEIPPHTRVAKMKKRRNNKCWQGSGEKGMLVHCWWECKLVRPLGKTVWSGGSSKN